MFLVTRVSILCLFSCTAVDFLILSTNHCLFWCNVCWFGFFFSSCSISLSRRSVPNLCSVPLSTCSLYWVQSCGSSTPSTFSLELHKKVQFHRNNNSVSCWFLLFQSSYIRMRLDWSRSQPESIPTISPAIRTTCWELSNSWILGERNYRHKNKIKYTRVLIQHFKAYL